MNRGLAFVAAILLAAVAANEGSCGASDRADRARLRIGTYYLKRDCRTEAAFRDMKACGIDTVVDEFGDDPKSVSVMRSLGLTAVPSSGFPRFWGGDDRVVGRIAQIAPVEAFERSLREYRPTAVDEMVDIGDEISSADFPHFGKVIARMRVLRPELKPYFNLHPAVQQDEYRRKYYGVDNYIDYIAAYVRQIPLDYISYDLYPYEFVDCPDWGFARFYDNLRIVADACRNSGRSFWYIAQANSKRAEDVTTANKMRYQAYAAMAFGAESLTWACWSPGWWTNNVLTASGAPTRQYERLKEVNAEIRQLDKVYMRLRRVDTHFTGFAGRASKWLAPDTRHTGMPQVNFNSPEGVSTAFFTDIRAEDGLPLVVGEFVSRNESDRTRAIFLFAADDPFDEHPTVRTVSFRTARDVRLFGATADGVVAGDRDHVHKVKLNPSGCLLVLGK